MKGFNEKQYKNRELATVHRAFTTVAVQTTVYVSHVIRAHDNVLTSCVIPALLFHFCSS